MTIDIKKFAEQFQTEYDALYNRDDGGRGADGYAEAVDSFDILCAAHFPLIGEFARYRLDAVTSDREAAAFMFALAKMEA